MIEIRYGHQTYRVSNETLRRVVGDRWERLDRRILADRLSKEHQNGRLVAEGHRLRLATPVEETEHRIRQENDPYEILRWSLLRIASGLAEIADEIRALRESVGFDSSAAAEKLTRDTPESRVEHRSTGGGAR